MSTVAEIKEGRVVIYSNDHRPAHVHVIGPDHEAVFYLNCPDGPIELRENYGFKSRAITQIKNELEDIRLELCKKWSEVHG